MNEITRKAARTQVALRARIDRITGYMKGGEKGQANVEYVGVVVVVVVIIGAIVGLIGADNSVGGIIVEQLENAVRGVSKHVGGGEGGEGGEGGN